MDIEVHNGDGACEEEEEEEEEEEKKDYISMSYTLSS
jgi:hypothetical protein